MAVYPSSFVTSPSDAEILKIANDLCRQIGYFACNPQRISWTERIGVRRTRPDLVMIFPDKIQLSTTALGKLSPGEWTPILAAALVLSKMQRDLGRLFKNLFLPFIAMFVVFPPVLILTFRYLSGPSVLAVVGTYLIVVIMLAIVVLIFARYLLSFKKGWFESDEQAARLVGRDAIIASLTKISSLDPGLSGRKGGMIVPSPTERIQRLSQ